MTGIILIFPLSSTRASTRSQSCIRYLVWFFSRILKYESQQPCDYFFVVFTLDHRMGCNVNEINLIIACVSLLYLTNTMTLKYVHEM